MKILTLAFAWSGIAFAQSDVVAPDPGSMTPNPAIDTDRPVGEEDCYPRGTVDAAGRIPTDKPLCDDLDLNNEAEVDVPEESDSTSVPEAVETIPDGGRASPL